MNPTSFFCSEISRGAGERTFGTASVGEVWLLLEYGGEWKPKAFEESQLPPEVKTHLGRALETMPRTRLLFIKHEREARDGLSFFLVRAREREPFTVRFRLGGYEELTKLDFTEIATRRALMGGSLTTAPLFLVCTHGRRDKCCAKFGYPLYKSLHGWAGDGVWQSSHVGGDRFAANLVCFPHGLFYAHVTEETGREVVEEYRRGRLVPGKYRGRACYSYHVQAAEFFVRRETTAAELDALRFGRSERLDNSTWRVRFVEAGGERAHEAVVSCRDSAFRSFITCHAPEPKSVPQFHLESYRAAGEL